MYDKFKKLSNFELKYVNFNPNILMDEKKSFNANTGNNFLISPH
jgi:hypothetical protein